MELVKKEIVFFEDPQRGYTIKTRNWYRYKTIAGVLNFISNIMGVGYHQENDFDNKYWVKIDNPLKAWTLWILFMLVKPLSGGWTYICRPGTCPDEYYKSIY